MIDAVGSYACWATYEYELVDRPSEAYIECLHCLLLHSNSRTVVHRPNTFSD